jgi:hypothetical protein
MFGYQGNHQQPTILHHIDLVPVTQPNQFVTVVISLYRCMLNRVTEALEEICTSNNGPAQVKISRGGR